MEQEKMNVQVKLNEIERVKDFVSTVAKYPFDIDIKSGRFTIDAKSIMGIFALDLSKPVTVISREYDARLVEELKAFM